MVVKKPKNLSAVDLFAIQLTVAQIPFSREFKFAEKLGRNWRFDFVIEYPIRLIAVEIEGGAGTGGRHTRIAGFTEYCHKYNAAGVMGWKVLRGPTGMVENGHLLQYVHDLWRDEPLPKMRGPAPYRRYTPLLDEYGPTMRPKKKRAKKL